LGDIDFTGLGGNLIIYSEALAKMFSKKHNNRILLFSVTLFLLMASFNIPLLAANNDLLFHEGALETNWEEYNTTIASISDNYRSNGSGIKTLKIQGNTVTYQETDYWGPEYSGGIYDIKTWVYEATLGDNFVSSDGENVQRIKLKTIDYYWQPFNQEEINDYSSNYRTFCGFIPSPGEIVHENDCNTPGDREVGIISYGLFQVDSNILYLTGNRDNDTYPTALNKDSWGIDKWSFVGGTGTSFTYYQDHDSDGYGDPNTAYKSYQPLPGYVTNNTDCNDSDSSIHPGATEIAGDGIYQDCNGMIKDFVNRFYVKVLDRQGEPDGLTSWTNSLVAKERAGSDVAFGFIFSQEFTNRGLDNEQFLTVLYNAFFDRSPDDGGYSMWMDKLNNGESKNEIVDGFLYSPEFGNLCADFGILPVK